MSCMRSGPPTLMAACMAVLIAPAALAADAVDVPAGFGVRPTGTMERVVYSEVVAQSPNPIHRATIEAQCATARSMGLTTRQPVFEPGHDEPLKTETLRFGNAQHRADFTTHHRYDCALPPRTTRSADMLCGCTYRVREQRSVHVESVAASATDHSRTLDLVRRLAPQVIGPGSVAGIQCIWRRQQLSDDVWIDRCIVEDDTGVLPHFLRGRALAETTFGHHGTSIHSSSRATRVLLDASVDAGVFAVRPDDVPKERTP
jgi:hypothetical protein